MGTVGKCGIWEEWAVRERQKDENRQHKHHTKSTPWDKPERSDVFDDRRLGLGLPGLEVGAEHVAWGGLDGGELEQRRLERVLRAAVDKAAPFEHGRRRVEQRGRHLRVVRLDRIEELVSWGSTGYRAHKTSE